VGENGDGIASMNIEEYHTSNALYRKFETNIPRNETAQPCSLHQSANPIQQNRQTNRLWEYKNRSQIHECRNWKRGCALRRAVSFLGIFVLNFRYSASREIPHGRLWTQTIPSGQYRTDSVQWTLYMYYSGREGESRGTDTIPEVLYT
jgi:hypothetical protein